MTQQPIGYFPLSLMTSNKLLIHFATKAEAAETLKKLAAKPTDKNLWECSIGWISIPGIGMPTTFTHLAPLIAEVEEIWSLGIAGTLHPDLKIGTKIQIATCQTLTHTELTIAENGMRLFSSDTPIHDKKTKQALGQNHDLIDMEGYAVAHLANHFNKPCSIWKWISDFAEEGGKALIQKHLPELSKKMAHHLMYLQN